MRNVSGDSGHVLPWLLIRRDGHGNRYRVGSYATRAEAEQVADRLGTGVSSVGSGGADDYVVEARDHGSDTRG